MKYLKKFENHTGYEGALATLGLPNVSACVQENEVHYTPYVPDPANGYEYVEIAGIKWATMNVGATSETDAGLYFQWGDTQGYTASQVGTDKQFSSGDYKYHNDTVMTKYNLTDGKTVLDLEDDAARANMGGSWRMPTEAEFQSLLDNTDGELTTVNGVNGYKFTDRTDNSKVLFFPTAGVCYYNRVINVGSSGNYWSSSRHDTDRNGIYLYFANGDINTPNFDRWAGFPVRGVLDLGE